MIALRIWITAQVRTRDLHSRSVSFDERPVSYVTDTSGRLRAAALFPTLA